jgi:hypothetical protein
MTVSTPTFVQTEEALSVSRVSLSPDRLRVTFDDEGLVANAGLMLVATLAARPGVGRIVKQTLGMVGLVGGARPGRKVLTLVHAIAAGASGTFVCPADVGTCHFRREWVRLR